MFTVIQVLSPLHSAVRDRRAAVALGTLAAVVEADVYQSGDRLLLAQGKAAVVGRSYHAVCSCRGYAIVMNESKRCKIGSGGWAVMEFIVDACAKSCPGR